MVSEMHVNDNTLKADKNLHNVTRLLFAIGVCGQWLFAFYIAVFYGGVVLNGTYEQVNEKLGHGIIEGDGMGNFMLAFHIFLAAIITLGGPLQFIAAIRKNFPLFHRWLGRLYFVTAFLISGAGLYMIYTRGAHGGTPLLLGNTLNASLIMTFSVLAWRMARQKDFQAHKRWAIRAFLMVSGVWFFRVGYGIWILITGFTAPGTEVDLTGPFDVFIGFGHSLIPLMILEFYFWAKSQKSVTVKKRVIIFFSFLAVLLAGGIVMAAFIFWIPQF
jgi:uncharacterized membrane protein YozB (DUF420 family)